MTNVTVVTIIDFSNFQSSSCVSYVVVVCSVFDLENHAQCNYDYLEVRETSPSGRLIGRYCGSEIPSNITAVNVLWLKFRSDSSATGVGFMAQYNTGMTFHVCLKTCFDFSLFAHEETL